MKVIKVTSFTEKSGLVLADYPELKAGPGQVVIKIEIAGVSTADVLARKGLYPGYSEPGFILGFEVAGTVISAFDEENEEWIGKRVYALTPLGGYAEQVVVSVDALIFIPERLSSSDAVGLGINALVAAFSLERVRNNNEQRILVRGAGGGIGSMVVILALMNRDHVTAVNSSPEKKLKLISLGVKDFISGKREDVALNSYDIIIDPVAGPDIDYFSTMLNENGHYVINGIAGGFPDPSFGSTFLTEFQKSLTISILSLNSIPISSIKSKMESIFVSAVHGRVKPIIDEIFSLTDTLKAHQRLESGSAFGKILLTNDR